MPEEKRTRCLIVGGGPAGLTAAIYTGRANLNPVIAHGGFEGGSMIPGGQLMITTEVENFPGFPEGVTGPELMEKMQKQASHFNIHEIFEFATDFKFSEDGPHRVELDGGTTVVYADAVILAMGAQAKWLGAPGEDKFMNKGISACATCDGPLPMFRNKAIVVVGGGDSAVEEATFLTKFASRVYMIVRRDVLRASKIMQDRALKNDKLEILWNSNIDSYLGGEDGMLSGIMLKDTVTGAVRQLDCAGVFMAIGHSPCTKSLQTSGLALDAQGYIDVKHNVFTSIPGVFAAGDIHDTHFRQAISAAGFGCMAAIAAERWLEGHRPVKKEDGKL